MVAKRPLKILHLVGDREDAGGVLSVIRNLHNASAADGWQHIVWVNQQYKETRQPALEYRYSRSVKAESTRHLDLLRQAAPATRELIDLWQEEHFDIIHAHSRGTLLVVLLFAWLTRHPVLFTNHNYANRTGLYRWAAKRKHMHKVVLTPNMANHYGLNSKNGKVRTISACYGDEFLQHPLVERRRFDDPDQPIRLVGVGSVIGWKKWDLVVEAIYRLPDALRHRVDFSIWGPTLQLPEAQAFAVSLNQMIERYDLGSQIHLRGSTTNVSGELLKSDVFLLPSTNEPCSIALMEALALGLPVIVSKSGGCVDIVKPDCGLHFQPDDPDSLRRCLEETITSPTIFNPPADIRNTVKQRCATEVFGAYEKLYQELVQLRPAKQDK
ncbi:MAG: Lipopolysaccharide core biosynthesis protein RfaG [Verrucomicrobia subdivision 3 bacterium]|nr:Lipopolysaccharide core biosynthesis protein RfaG [Limisphaerales bacterium]MCS1416592.1 Lipopolysaccharide core biosynthesis protein RfaG [Limisphaerales bacterium]